MKVQFEKWNEKSSEIYLILKITKNRYLFVQLGILFVIHRNSVECKNLFGILYYFWNCELDFGRVFWALKH
jgi:hypothetical protein